MEVVEMGWKKRKYSPNLFSFFSLSSYSSLFLSFSPSFFLLSSFLSFFSIFLKIY